MFKILLILCLYAMPALAQNLDKAIETLTQDPPGKIVTPQTTDELQQLFSEATLNHVPRIFVDKLPTDFPEKGSPELYMHVITALILRFNEQAVKEKIILTALKQKFEKHEPWSKTEESFFHFLVEKYDVVVNKTIATKLDQLTQKVDEIVPGLAVAQGVYATDWGTKNLNHPYGQMGWLDENTYTEIPYDSLIKATEAYFKEMNSTPTYWMWRTHRQSAAHRGITDRLANHLAGSLTPYRPEDPYYSATIQKIIQNNPTLSKLYNTTFLDK